jgi:hypothetical protein
LLEALNRIIDRPKPWETYFRLSSFAYTQLFQLNLTWIGLCEQESRRNACTFDSLSEIDILHRNVERLRNLDTQCEHDFWGDSKIFPFLQRETQLRNRRTLIVEELNSSVDLNRRDAFGFFARIDFLTLGPFEMRLTRIGLCRRKFGDSFCFNEIDTEWLL